MTVTMNDCNYKVNDCELSAICDCDCRYCRTVDYITEYATVHNLK